MDDAVTPQLLLILAAILLVFVNGFFVAAEFSIVKIRATRIDELIQQGTKGALRARLLVDNMDEYLSASQLGITLASLALGWIGEPAFARLFAPAFEGLGWFEPVFSHSLAVTVAFLLITFLHIVLGEQAPKYFAIQKSESVVLATALPLIWFYRVSYPLIWFLNNSANLLLRMMGTKVVPELETAHSEEELRMILAHSREKGFLEMDEQRMLESVLDLGDRSARQIMVPSGDVIFLDTELGFEENLHLTRTHRHTRFPLCDGTLDHVIGLVHVKDFLWHLQELGPEFELKTIRRPVRFILETQLVKDLLPEFRKGRTHLSVVVNEFGSTVGILTLEDILEELVGEIQDEFDTEAPTPMVQRRGDGSYIIHGRMLLEDLEDELDIDLNDDENDTVGGHVMMLLGRVARVGDEVTIAEQFVIRVQGMRNLQITDLSLERLEH